MPVRVRLYFALALASLVLVPVLPPMPEVDALSLRSSLLVAEQVLIGVALELSLQLFLSCLCCRRADRFKPDGSGTRLDGRPDHAYWVPVLGQFYLMLVTLLFLLMNGHLVVFEVLAESFVTIPVG